MKAYRDLAAPLEAHSFVLDRVPFSFGDQGLLLDPDADQLEVMTATPLRRARFVEVDPPKPPAPLPPDAATQSDAPAKTDLPAPAKAQGRKAPAPASDEGATK